MDTYKRIFYSSHWHILFLKAAINDRRQEGDICFWVNTILSYFDWSDSKEGLNYWSKINDIWIRLKTRIVDIPK